MKENGASYATFAYNGDGARTRATINGVTTLYAGAIEYEIAGSTTLTKHYDAGGQRVAVRNGSALNFLLQDHLGSTSVMLKSNGGFWGELRYAAWGETRYTQGTIVTDRQYTGQLNDGDTGLYYYNARYYDPALHKFIQADTIVPDPNDPQTLNRYAYVNNNPIRYNDPTGHYPCAFCDLSIEPTGGNYAGTQMADYSDVGPGASSVQGSMNFNASRIQSPISCKFCDEVLSGEIFGLAPPSRAVASAAIDDIKIRPGISGVSEGVENLGTKRVILFGTRSDPTIPQTRPGKDGKVSSSELDPIPGLTSSFGREPDANDMYWEVNTAGVQQLGGIITPDGGEVITDLQGTPLDGTYPYGHVSISFPDRSKGWVERELRGLLGPMERVLP